MIKGFLLQLSIIIAMVISSCTGNSNKDKAIDAAKVSAETIPSLSLKDINGNSLNLTDFKGKKVFVNMWATWCPPCRAEMPSIQQLYEKTKDKNVQFVMIALDEDFNKSISYMQSSALLLPAFHPADALPALLDVQGIPATFIFDESGSLIKKIEGGENYNTPEYAKLLSR
ncbi:MAG: TlpA family protein disulfide reductase [Chitinophagaceae bacterium]|nr:TlpA family protein disulfide reductase [Chitinophagaceae bacterium]